MGSLNRERAAPQRQRFRQGSIPGDAGGPSAPDALPSIEHSTDPARRRRGLVEEIIRGMFGRFDQVAKAGGILRVCVLFPGVSVVNALVIQDATSDK